MTWANNDHHSDNQSVVHPPSLTKHFSTKKIYLLQKVPKLTIYASELNCETRISRQHSTFLIYLGFCIFWCKIWTYGFLFSLQCMLYYRCISIDNMMEKKYIIIPRTESFIKHLIWYYTNYVVVHFHTKLMCACHESTYLYVRILWITSKYLNIRHTLIMTTNQSL